MALHTRYSRSRSARAHSAGSKKTASGADLHEMSRSKTCVAEFAAEHSLRTKSEVGVEQARREAKRDGRHQAWAPPKRHSLSSSSARFQRDPHQPLPPHPTSSAKGGSSSESRREKPKGAVHLQQLDKLREIFDEATRSGDGRLDEDEFLRACSKVFGEEAMSKNEEQMRIVFKKIDNLSNDFISWDDFCTFLYLEYRERDNAETRAKKVDFNTPAMITKGCPHHGLVCAVQHTSDGSMVTCSEEGTVCFWSQELELKRTKPPTQVNVELREKPKWVSDMVLSLPHKKIILSTGDCELQFYEMVNFEPYCQLSRLESIPLKIVCWHDPEDEVKTVILLGDKDGAVTVMIAENIMNAFTQWKAGPKLEGLPTYPLYKLLTDSESGVKCYRWKLHSSWVTELHYLPKLLMFASCSLDPSASLVLGSLTPSTEVDAFLRQTSVTRSTKRSLLPARRLMSCDQRVFRMAKGVSSADYCSRHNVLVTGSADRLVRVWNPFMTSKPVGILQGHTAPVFFVKADSPNSRLFSIGNDNTIMVWDTLEFNCLSTVYPSVHKFSVPTQAAHYNDVGQQVVLAADEVGVVQLVRPLGVRQDMVQTHRSPVTGVAFSACFNHLITACRDGVVKIWDMETGKKEFEFSVGSCGISAMAVDKTGKRVVTGSSNGQLKVWSYNSGECLKTLDKENQKEVTRTRFVSVNQCKYIVAAGWDKKVTIFHDVADTIQEVYKPMRVWTSTSDAAHQTDILAVAYGAPHFLATASFCGKIVVWSLISFCIFNELKAEYPTSAMSPPSELEGDNAVQDLVFLEQRTKSKHSASLVASGPAGYIHFWNIYDASKPMASFRASNFNCVTSLAVDQNGILLFSGDIEGYLSLWRIESYCIRLSTKIPPKRAAVWRAHTQRVTQLLFVEQWNTIISASVDTSVRVWTLEGNFIGTFGQENPWALGVPMTYQHPLNSRDLLLHTEAVPASSLPPDSSQGESEGEEEFSKRPRLRKLRAAVLAMQTALTVTEMEDEDVDDKLLEPYGISLDAQSEHIKKSKECGKWLRHHRTQSAQPRKLTGPQKVYRLLPYQTLDPEPDFHNMWRHIQ